MKRLKGKIQSASKPLPNIRIMCLFGNSLFVISVLVLMQSCKPDFPSWEVNSVFPFFNTRMYISDFAGDTLISEDDDSLLNLYYDYNLSDFNFSSLVSGLDTVASYMHTSPFTLTLPPGSQVVSKTEISKLTLKDVYLKTLAMSYGKFKIRTANKYTQPIRIEFSIPQLTVGGIPFTIIRDIPAAISPAKPSQYEEDITFTNLRWEFFTQGLANINCFNTSFKVWISPLATENVQVSAGDPFPFFLGFSELNISYARGYFGQHQYTFQNEQAIDLFRKVSADQLKIEDVMLKLEVTNNMGMDLRLRLRQLYGINITSGNTVEYEGPWLNTPIQIARATETAPENGLSQVMTFSYDLSVNSNLRQFIENMPGTIFTDFEFDLNPLGNISSGNDFYYGVPLSANLLFKMPLVFSLMNLRVTDTLEFDSGFLKQQMKMLTLKAVVQNCFPLEMNLVLSFLDSNKILLSTHQFDRPVRASPVLANGRTAGPEQTTVFLHVSGQELQKIRDGAKFVKITSSVSTKPTGENVRIYADYYLDINTYALLRLFIQGEVQ